EGQSSLSKRASVGCCGWPPPPQAHCARRHSIECSFARTFLRLAHASPPGNLQANRPVRLDPLVRRKGGGWANYRYYPPRGCGYKKGLEEDLGRRAHQSFFSK